LRMSAGARLGLACAPVAMIWLAIFWARG
jgi:hypothetical protein